MVTSQSSKSEIHDAAPLTVEGYASAELAAIEGSIRSVPNFPKAGILFRDIMGSLQEPRVFKLIVDGFVRDIRAAGATHIVCPEARGYVYGCPAAYVLELPVVCARKPNKLPGATVKIEYGLEYGHDELHIQKDALKPGDRAYIVDDLLATGGTVVALVELCRKMGAEVVGCGFLIALKGLHGFENVSARCTRVRTILTFDEEEQADAAATTAGAPSSCEGTSAQDTPTATAVSTH